MPPDVHAYHDHAAPDQGVRGRLSLWLCPTELDRRRIIDANRRVRTIRYVGSIAVGIALLLAAPLYGWWTLLLFTLVAADFLTVERRMARSAFPEIISAVAILNTIIVMAVGVAITGGPTSPALPWLVMPAAVVAARFPPRVVATAVLLTALAMLAATLGFHAAAVLHNPTPLFSSLALLIGVVAIVAALQDAELRHRDEAVLDPLTGLLNRHALAPRFAEIRQQARIADQPVCLVLCDVDEFKAVNDAHGHDVGDNVLRDVAYELRKGLRSFELVYRLGGEEFLIVLPGIDLEGGHQVAERIRAAIHAARPGGVAVTISAGLSAAHGDGVRYDDMFKVADRALYGAKRAGRNRVVAGEAGPGAVREPFPAWTARSARVPGDAPAADALSPGGGDGPPASSTDPTLTGP